MKNTLMTAAAAAAVFAAAPMSAQAQDAVAPMTGAYANLGYAHIDTDPGKLGALTGRLGYRFTPWIGAEGELAVGVRSDKVTDAATGLSARVKLKHEAAAYVVGFLPVASNTELLARVGYGTSKIKASIAGVSASDSEESINYGIGAQHHFDGLNGVRVDFTRFDFDNGGGNADVLSIGYSRKF